MKRITNKADFDLRAAPIRAWIAAALADGWYIAPTYGDGEPVDSAASLSKDGFAVLVTLREPTKWMPAYDVSIAAWGPDALGVKVPDVYSMAALQAELRSCHDCGARDVETVRIGFAGRCCAECRPKLVAKHEYPGWTN
jgi:hypothetical protein